MSQAAGATTLVISQNSTTTQGTIYISNSYSTPGERLVITGGTVSNTSTTTGNAIRNDTYSYVTISGGTVSKAGSGDYAVYKYGSGAIYITAPPAVITGNTVGSNITYN